MALPYSTATSGKRAVEEIEKILRAFGCSNFGTLNDFDSGEVRVQFTYRGRCIDLKASAQGYAAAWLRENPWTHRRQSTRTEHERKAVRIGQVAVYSILRDWIKGQITAVECGVLSFEGAFLGSIMLPSGRTMIEQIEADKMLPPPINNNGETTSHD